MIATRSKYFILVAIPLAAIAQEQKPPDPIQWQAGPVNIRPTGFLDWIGEWRSAPTSDSVWTHFARIPLTDGPDEYLGSPGHSRAMVKGTMNEGGWSAAGYYEFDFIDPNRKDPYRLRQVWGEVEHDGWRVLGGKAWSLLRPNRHGMASDTGMMNTDVIEPAYHVGLVGNRRQQLRLTKQRDHWGTAFAFERRSESTGGDFLWKVMHENHAVHLEAIALAGGAARRAFSIAGVVPITSKVRFVTQEFIAHNAAAEALTLVPVRASGGSFIQGIEANVTKRIEVYSYGGLVYGSRSNGNRICREWTIGASRKTPAPGNYGSFVTGFQYSQMDREPWRGGRGAMNYMQVQFRYNLW